MNQQLTVQHHPIPGPWRILIAFLFAVAMAYNETAGAIYARSITDLSLHNFMRIEAFRQPTTLLMIAMVSCLAGRSGWERLGFFIFQLGLWDAFFYAWYRVSAGWPTSLLTWDALCVVPVIWWAPVFAPILVSLTLTVAGLVIVLRKQAGGFFNLTGAEWSLEGCAFFLVFLSFVWGYPPELFHQDLLGPYKWQLLATGEVLGIAVFIKALRRTKRVS